MDVKFAIRSHVPEYLAEIEKQIEEVKWKMASTMEELQREEAIRSHVPEYLVEIEKQIEEVKWKMTSTMEEQAILTQAKFNFQVKKQEEEMDVKFAIRSHVPEYLVEIEKQIEEVKWKMASTMEELQREEAILTQAKFNFQVKKQEFVRFMVQSSQYAMQMQYLTQATPRRSTPRGSNNNGNQ